MSRSASTSAFLDRIAQSGGRVRRIAAGWLAALFGLPVLVLGQAITEFPVPTEDSAPFRIATGSDGALWFTETLANKIGRITTAGVVTEFPIPTFESRPTGIAAGPDGALWFTESFGGKIGRITTAGAINEFPLPVGSDPVEITAGPDGALWYTRPSFSADRIGRITTTGVITEYSVRATLTGPTGITAGPDGALWFAVLYVQPSGGKIGRITTAGVVTEFSIPTASSTFGITAGPDGALWFTEESDSKIGRITTAGEVTEFPLPRSFSQPDGITAGPDGALWFTEISGVIGRITTAGVINEYPTPTSFAVPRGIAVGPDGALWFTEQIGNKIGRITPGVIIAQRRILPAVGSTPGAGGTFFRTSVQLHNPGSAPIAGRIVYHPSGLSGGDSDPSLSYSLAPGETQSFADLLPAMGRSGLGSADILVVSGTAPVTTARVFNDAGEAGTTGFTEEPLRVEEALQAGQYGVLLVPVDLAAFRLNMGVRTLEAGASLTLTVRDAAWAVLAVLSRSFPATYHLQQGASDFLAGPPLPAGGSVTVAIASGSAVVYGATVDNRTGDPSLQIARAAR